MSITSKIIPKKIDYSEIDLNQSPNEGDQTSINTRQREIISSPLKWMGCKDKILDKFESLYPDKNTNVITESAASRKTKSEEPSKDTPKAEEDTATESEPQNIVLQLYANTKSNIDKIDESSNKEINHMDGIKCFIEPFMGGATNSIYISQKFPWVEQFYGSDALVALTNFYKVIEFYRDDFDRVFGELKDNYDKACKTMNTKIEYFEIVRKWYNDLGSMMNDLTDDYISIERAAGFYFLSLISPMKGYRVNTDGHYNGSANKTLMKCPVPEGSLDILSNLLTKMYVVHANYSNSLNFIDYLLDPRAIANLKSNFEDVNPYTRTTTQFPKEDKDPMYMNNELFVYIDPPALTSQTPLDLRIGGNVEIFVHNSKSIRGLAEYCNELTERNIKWLMSIENTICLKEFYKNYKYGYNTKELVNTGIRNPQKRLDEVFIYNYDIELD